MRHASTGQAHANGPVFVRGGWNLHIRPVHQRLGNEEPKTLGELMSDVTKAAAPIMAAFILIVVTIAFPSPQSLLSYRALLPSGHEVPTAPEAAVGPSAATLAEGYPVEPMVSRIEASGCLDRLQNATEETITECSKLVADAVVEIARTSSATKSPTQDLLFERLRLAAANVCRARWANSDSMKFDLTDPVCVVSTSRVALK